MKKEFPFRKKFFFLSKKSIKLCKNIPNIHLNQKLNIGDFLPDIFHFWSLKLIDCIVLLFSLILLFLDCYQIRDKIFSIIYE